jgi:hypothetical protein
VIDVGDYAHMFRTQATLRLTDLVLVRDDLLYLSRRLVTGHVSPTLRNSRVEHRTISFNRCYR